MNMLTIWMNGTMVPAAEARVSIFDHGLLYGDGVFEGVRFYARVPFRLDAHLARLERSAAAIDLAIPYARADLAAATRAVAAGGPDADGYLRLVVTRGEGDFGLDPRSCSRPTVFVASRPLRIFENSRQAGVDVVTASTRSMPLDALDPRIKSLNYVNRLLARLEANRAGAGEAVMLDHRGRIAEGTTNNVFLAQGGALRTPRPVDGALEGITRGIVLDLARDLGIPARETPLGVYDLRTADEAFLVGTGAGLVPVRAVDGRLLGACPGPIFERIDAAYAALVQRESAVAPDFAS